MSVKKIIGIFLILCLVSLAFSQNIITSWHYDKVQMYDIQKMSKILTTQLKDKVTDLPEFEEEQVKISNLELIDVQISLYDSYLNYKTGLFLYTPNKVTLSFNFTYSYESTKEEVSLDLKVNYLKVRIKNNKESQTQTSVVNITASQSDYTLYGVTDKTLVDKIKLALYKGFENNSILNNKIAAKIDLVNYYKDFYKKKKPYKFTAGTFFDSKTYDINLDRFIGFCEDVTGNLSSGICYYSGEIEEDKTDKSKVPISNENFTNAEDSYKMFINADLISLITSKMASEGIKEKTYKEGSTPKELSYDFTVSSLKKYFSGLQSFSDDTYFETRIKITDITINKVKFTVSFNIGTKENVFSIDVESEIKAKVPILKTVRFNICLDSTSTTNVKIKSGSGISITNEEFLKKVIDESFDPSNVPLCLNENGITLRDYFSFIKNGYILNEGIYLEGNQLYQ